MRATPLIGLGALATGIGIWLGGSVHVEPPSAIAKVLGHEGQAMLQHGLLGFGITLLVPLLILAAWWLVVKAQAWPATPASTELNSPAPALDDVVHPKRVFAGTMLAGPIYLAAALGLEWLQAGAGTSGEPAQGGFDGNTLVASVLGVLAATSVARWVARRS